MQEWLKHIKAQGLGTSQFGLPLVLALSRHHRCVGAGSTVLAAPGAARAPPCLIPQPPCPHPRRFEEPLLQLVRRALLAAYEDEGAARRSGWAASLADLPRGSSAPLEQGLCGCIRWGGTTPPRARRRPRLPAALRSASGGA